MGFIRLISEQAWAFVELREGRESDPELNKMVEGFPKPVEAGIIYTASDGASLFWRRELTPGVADSGMSAKYDKASPPFTGTDLAYIR